ncbi:MAG: ATP-binding protein [Formivibrio sp.]|nr:ATP-binding protein [Formivibrio sp.]
METNHLSSDPPWWRKTHSLKIEIALAFGVLIVLMLALGMAFHLSEQRSALALDKLLKTDARMADLSLRSELAMLKAGDSESDFLISVDQIGVTKARERYVLPMQNHLIDMQAHLTSIRPLSSDPGILNNIDQIEQQTKRYKDGFLVFVDLYGKPGQENTADKARQDNAAAARAIESLLEDLHTTVTKRALQTRNSVESAANITRWTVFIAVVIAILLGTTVAIIVWRHITNSVRQLVTFSKSVATGDFSARAPQSREHEFTILAQAMNQMVESLEHSQAKLLVSARLAGMAEIATNVLHNVSNVLNSVNVSAGLVSTQLRTSKVKGLARAVALMDEHATDLGEFLMHDAKGKQLPNYLRELAQALETEHETMTGELRTLCKSIDHIKEVVATQQSYAGTPHFIEPVKLNELVDDALRMNIEALMRHKVEVVKDLTELPTLQLDRNRVLQILVNLISNAKQAMNDMIDRSPCITIGAALADGQVLRITVADNGEGIAPDNLTRVFSHGFTTRKNGHGFGLHSCMLAAQEMGGSLTACSAGLGQGATFTLDIPVNAPEGQ